jgi:hypothetical protein
MLGGVCIGGGGGGEYVCPGHKTINVPLKVQEIIFFLGHNT